VTGRKGGGRTGGMSLLFGMEMEFTDGKFVLFVARARARARAMVKLSDKFVLARSALLSVRKTTGGSRR